MIPIIKPVLGEREGEAAKEAVLSGWVTQGPRVKAFEEEFASYVGAKHGCAVSNCTVALHLALRAVGVGAGDEVITVSHSFVATANAIRYLDAVPVFVDIDPVSLNLDAKLLKGALSEKTKAILCVHQLGLPCDLKALVAFSKEHGIPLIEDAACAIGSEILWDEEWQKIGRPHGDIACFSFHPRKVMTTGDGGMLTTNNADFDGKFRLWRQHGMSVPDTVRHDSRQVIFEGYVELGYNYRMTDIQAAVGRVQLERLPEILDRRRALAERYCQLLGESPYVRCVEPPAWGKSNWQSFCVRIPRGVPQQELMQFLLDKGVSSRRGVMCSHLEEVYKGKEPCRIAGGGLPHSERARDEGIILPLYHGMSDEEQRLVCCLLEQFCEAKGVMGAG